MSLNSGNTHPNLVPCGAWKANSFSSVWETDCSSWSSPSCDNCSTFDDGIGETIASDPEKSIHANENPAVGEFDPFHTPSALWMSQLNDAKDNFSGSSESSTWSFSLFSDPIHTPISESTDREENIARKREPVN
ncbi:hypothetical protein X975_15106, partial [Stegodyphus mimosarum]